MFYDIQLIQVLERKKHVTMKIHKKTGNSRISKFDQHRHLV